MTAGRAGSVARVVAAVGLVAAGVAHVVAAGEHLGHTDHGGAGVVAAFLGVAGLVQLWATGPVVAGRLRTVPVLGLLATTVALVLLYLVSRRVPLPLLHPGADRPEDADVLGLLAVTAEVLTLATLPALLAPALRRAVYDTVLVLGTVTWLAWLSGFLG
ncbi:hypothetical protein [Pseudonocardia alni]|uniref:hypothetical protein n=1 Tax=Pseudonocardia alni TaxID=33907 RepID=UPI003324A7F9